MRAKFTMGATRQSGGKGRPLTAKVGLSMTPLTTFCISLLPIQQHHIWPHLSMTPPPTTALHQLEWELDNNPQDKIWGRGHLLIKYLYCTLSFILALLSQNFYVEIDALFPQIFCDWKADSANFIVFRMYDNAVFFLLRKKAVALGSAQLLHPWANA